MTAPYLDLGEQPLANALVDPEGIDFLGARILLQKERYPLQVVRCHKCHLSQLTVVVDPTVLYAGYRFRSGVSQLWRKHCVETAEAIHAHFGRRGKVLDIAANDGTQLMMCFDRGWEVHGVDPSPCAEHNKMPVMEALWTEDYAREYRRFHDRVDCVIAQNVLGHVDDPIGFLKGVTTVLAANGRVIVEVPHVGDLIYTGAFDTIYHEHLSYWHLKPLRRAAREAGLMVTKVERLLTHGGSRRYWLAHEGSAVMEDSVYDELIVEHNLQLWRRETVQDFAGMVDTICEKMDAMMVQHMNGKVCYGWGASAKATVMLNANGVTPHYLQYVIDETPEKQGMLMPGVHIPIIAPPDDLSKVDVLWLLSWNNAEALKAKARTRGFRGQFLVTTPEPTLSDA